MLKNIFFLIVSFSFFHLNAQVKNQTGTILGVVYYEDYYIDSSSNIEPIAFAKVCIWQDRKIVQCVQTNFDGEFKLNPQAGVYELKVDFSGYETYKIEELTVLPNEQIDLVVSLKSEIKEIEIISYKIPLLNLSGGAQGTTITRKYIRDEDILFYVDSISKSYLDTCVIQYSFDNKNNLSIDNSVRKINKENYKSFINQIETNSKDEVFKTKIDKKYRHELYPFIKNGDDYEYTGIKKEIFIKIFPDYPIEHITKYQDENYIYVKFINLTDTKNDFFAIEVKNNSKSYNGVIYYFYKNKIITKHNLNNFKLLNIKSYRNKNNDLIISYTTLNKINTWDADIHYYFFKLNGKKLENVFDIGYPIIRKNNNRYVFYKSIVKSYEPLVFLNTQEYNFFTNNYSNEYNLFYKDSIELRYNWSKNNQAYNLITDTGVLNSFNEKYARNLRCEDLYFIYKNPEEIKAILTGNDEDLKKNLLKYLKTVLERNISDE